MPTNYISINPDLVDEFGHYLYFDKKIEKSIKDKHTRLIILANKKVKSNLQEHGNILPSFSTTTWHEIPLLDLASLQTFKKQMREAILQLNTAYPNSDNVFFFYMSSIWHAFVLMELAAECYNPLNSFILNVFHDRERLMSADFQKSPYFEEYKRIIKLADKSKTSLKFRLCLDTTDAIKHIKQLTGIELEYWPMFSVTMLDSITAKKEPAKKSTFQVCFPSNVQRDKGFDLLPPLTKAFLKDKSVSFSIRSKIAFDKRLNSIVDFLREMKNVTVIDGVLSEKEYADLLQTSDIILIPYRKKAFYSRTSGIFVDALRLGKPVVTTRETWMGRLTEKYGNGATFSDENVEEFIQALYTVKENFSYYQANARATYEAWKKVNGIRNLISFFNKSVENSKENTTALPAVFLQQFSTELKAVKTAINKRNPSKPILLIQKIRRTEIAFKIKQLFLPLFYRFFKVEKI